MRFCFVSRQALLKIFKPTFKGIRSTTLIPKSVKDLILRGGEFKHEVRQFQKPYDNQQAEQISLMV